MNKRQSKKQELQEQVDMMFNSMIRNHEVSKDIQENININVQNVKGLLHSYDGRLGYFVKRLDHLESKSNNFDYALERLEYKLEKIQMQLDEAQTRLKHDQWNTYINYLLLIILTVALIWRW